MLVARVGERDLRHVADHDAAVLDLRADVEALHRLVEIGLDRDARLEPAARADHEQQQHADDDRADHEQPELEVVGFASSRQSGGRRLGLAAEERPHARIVAFVAQLARDRPSAMIPRAARSQQDDPIGGDEHAARDRA